MNDDDRRRMLEQKAGELRARMKSGAVEHGRKMIATVVGAHLAARGVEMEFDESVPDDVREAALQGYLAQSLGELAHAPPIVTDVPLLRRIFTAAVSLIRPRKPVS